MAGFSDLSWRPWRPLGNGKYLPVLEIPEEGTSLEGIVKELIEIALKQTDGNQTRAAHLLGISRDTLRYRIKKFDLAKDSHQRSAGNGNSTDEFSPESAAL